jgi:gamma-glutamyltranspeptidase / glutathione hydrolase
MTFNSGNFLIRWAVRVALVAALAWQGVAVADCGIASAHPLATRAGCEILESGGNAFDAAVAVATTLAVVEPFASGMGGGGFFLLHRAADGADVFVDARETAPTRATRNFFIDAQGQPRQKASLEGATAAGIPGQPAAIDWIARRYGTFPLSRTLASAIRLAEEGFETDARYLKATEFRESLLKGDPGATAIFLEHEKPAAAGFRLVQKNLARTLRMIAARGADGFYRGDFAREMVEAVRAGGGLWELQDMQGYRVIEREPLRFEYRGAKITTAPLPSSGGLVLAQCLHILEARLQPGMSATTRAHLVVEAMRRGYQDRARYMGDPAFVPVPVARLASRDYARTRAVSIDTDRATPSTELGALAPEAGEGRNTTHFSIIDADGNRVAATLSVNGPFGSGFVAGSSGVLLNNHMNDFALAAGQANAYGLVEGAANLIDAGKRPLSSMSPTFVEDSRGVLVLGTPGGSRIISMVLQGILDYVDQPEPDLARLVSAARFHHQYLPDRIEIEPGGFPEDWIGGLKSRGHTVEVGRRRWGNMQAVRYDRKTGRIESANDPRGQGGVLF